ncbi:ribonuclease HIII [Litchfieldia salsa]|uniref:Ribonuclease HIII n=1 Tax=Litchfieldia salsa TaxID=930152 RepID=A0A1H0NZL0_9BACI|nr:ribonuclease HIII [Litchfieldia salsa]SDO97946.1 ribonuclease HIII [Litchfieldia salsa]
MSNSVLKVDMSMMKKIESHYSQYKGDKLPPGSVFVAKLPSCTITGYKSGKVLFQGGSAEAESSKWAGSHSEQTSKSSKNVAAKARVKHEFSPPKEIATLSIIGSDEVGTGDYFGPMTVVASYVSKDQVPLLTELGVKDSKNLNDKQICEIAKNIIEVIPYSLLILHNPKYNKLQSSGMTQGKIKALLHNQAINHLLEKIAPTTPDGILIDQFAEPGVYFRHLQGQGKIAKENVFFSTKAEGVHLSVAASSIIARYAFVKEFEKLSKKAGVELPKGAGAKVDVAAAKLIKKLGVEALGDYTKLHFANTDKAKKIANT